MKNRYPVPQPVHAPTARGIMAALRDKPEPPDPATPDGFPPVTPDNVKRMVLGQLDAVNAANATADEYFAPQPVLPEQQPAPLEEQPPPQTTE